MKLKQNRLVIKVGTSTITNENGSTDFRAIDNLAMVLSDLQNKGYEIILVSSAAIALGFSHLGFKERPTSIRMLQASAAVGQNKLMSYYNKCFNDYDKTIAQILLSAEDILDDEKEANLINTFEALLEKNVIPIVNENDSVNFTEIESEDKLFGDNDLLSAIVANLTRAGKLIILSDIDGFFDKDPRLYPDAQIVHLIDDIEDDRFLDSAGGAGSRRGTGGMMTKIQAATLAHNQGIDTIITNGRKPKSLYEILQGEEVGTLILGNKDILKL